MKQIKILCIFFLTGLITGNLCNAQTTLPATQPVGSSNPLPKSSEDLHTWVEAQFPGGPQAWNDFIYRNLNLNVPSNNNAPVGEYLGVVSFLVQKDGSVAGVKTITNPGYGTGGEVVRVFKKSPKWMPATRDGVPVTYSQKQKITFLVSVN